MVFFVCVACNETLKKNQVDKHCLKCRRCDAVTCIDCSVTFYGDDYAQHISCISEAEKYEKSLYKGKPKKLNPQDLWKAILDEAVDNCKEAPMSIQSHLVRLGEAENVPRNKKKFENFVKNSLKLNSPHIIGEMWTWLEALQQRARAAQESAAQDSKSPAAVSTVAAVITSADEECTPTINNNIAEDAVADKKHKHHHKPKKDKSDKAEQSTEVETFGIVELKSVATVEEDEHVAKKHKKHKSHKHE